MTTTPFTAPTELHQGLVLTGDALQIVVIPNPHFRYETETYGHSGN